MSKNILIFRTDRIGDLIVSCPAIITIKNYFTGSKITLITSKKNYQYAKELDIFYNIYIYPDLGILKKIFFTLKLKKLFFDYIFILDGKERSILTSFFIKSNYKASLLQKIKKYHKLLKIKFYIFNEGDNLQSVYQKLLSDCNIALKINNFNFLSKIKDNNFSSNIITKNYIHIHLDEKWFNNLYIASYTKINPIYSDFTDFLNKLSEIDNVLITTGLKNFKLLDELKKSFFTKNNDKIYFKNNLNKSIYLICQPTYKDIDSLLRRSKIIITCHGSITHASNSFNVKIIDIIEKNKFNFYKSYNTYLKNYKCINRSDFKNLSNQILNLIKE